MIGMNDDADLSVRTIWLAVMFFAALLGTSADAQQLSWEPAGQLFGGSVLSLSSDTSGARVFAGTYDSGVFRSTDRGATWAGAERSGITSSVVELHSFASGEFLLAETYQGVFASSDAGATWDSVAAKGQISIDDTRATAYLVNSEGSFRSSDHGITWVQLGDTVPALPTALTLTDSGALVMAADRTLYRSEDNGRNWGLIADSVGGSYGTIQRLLVASDGTIFGAGYRVGILRSTDDGTTWSSQIDGLDASSRSWMITLAGERRLLAAGDSGDVYSTSDNGDTWRPTGVSLGAGPQDLLALSPQEILAGFDDYGIEISSDGGMTFTSSNIGLTALGNTSPVIAVDRDNQIYAATSKQLYRAAAGTNEWSQLPVPKSPLPVFPIAVTDDGWIVAGGIQSTDNGATWRVEVDGLGAFGRTLTDAEIDRSTGKVLATTVNGLYAVREGSTEWGWPRLGGIGLSAITAHPSGQLFTGGVDFMMFRSTDGGLEWEEAGNGLPTTGVRRTHDLGVDELGFIYASTYQGVYRSIDTGRSWHRLPVGSDSLGQFGRMLVNPRGAILVVAGNGYEPLANLYVSTDRGVSWTEQTEVPGEVRTFALDSTGRIYAGILGGRIVRTRESTSAAPSRRNVPPPRFAFAVGPNPTGGSLRVDIDNPNGQKVIVRVFDLLYREVEVFRGAEPDHPGQQQLTLELSSVPAGRYFLFATAGSERGSTMIEVVH